MEGEYICLPHKDTSGPQTMECAFGLKTAEGNYALDTSKIGNMMEMATGSKLSISGMLVPIEMISGNQWQKYNLNGIVQVTFFKKL